MANGDEGHAEELKRHLAHATNLICIVAFAKSSGWKLIEKAVAERAAKFHWSRNEIAVAREFGEAYALYLVDRTRCGMRGYVPQVITGPTPEMFAIAESGWRVEATAFEHVAVAN